MLTTKEVVKINLSKEIKQSDFINIENYNQNVKSLWIEFQKEKEIDFNSYWNNEREILQKIYNSILWKNENEFNKFVKNFFAYAYERQYFIVRFILRCAFNFNELYNSCISYLMQR